MKKIATTIFVLIFLFYIDGATVYADNKQSQRYFISDEDIVPIEAGKGDKYVVKYKNNVAKAYELPSCYMAAEDNAQGIQTYRETPSKDYAFNSQKYQKTRAAYRGFGSGHEGVFAANLGFMNVEMIFNLKKAPFKYYYVAPLENQINYVSSEYYADTIMFSNGYTAYERLFDKPVLDIVKPDGSMLNLDFNYTYHNKDQYKGDYWPVAANYSKELKQYVVIFSYIKNRQPSNSIGKAYIAYFDENGKKTRGYMLNAWIAEAYATGTIPSGLGSNQWFIDTYFSPDNPYEFFIEECWYENKNFNLQEYEKNDAADGYWNGEYRGDPNECFNTLKSPNKNLHYVASSLKIDLNAETNKFISHQEYINNLPPTPKLPFLIELKENETLIWPRNKTTGTPLYKFDRSFIPIDYSLNADGSCDMIFAQKNEVAKDSKVLKAWRKWLKDNL